ncbi:MAG: chemotaxis response regulator protein-glutamate methylesterase [Polyangiaceae bacterium]
MKPIRVMLVDDSALVRQALRNVLEDGSGQFVVIAAVGDPFQAAAALRDEVPDVIVLDIEMPKMDGVTFLRKLMRQHPIPTVICSSLAREGASVTLAALEAGAVEIILKPDLSTRDFFEQARARIQDIVRAAASARVFKRKQQPAAPIARPHHLVKTTDRVVVVGASTGGTEAIAAVLAGLDAHCPGVAIVQHMPPGFTASFAKRLNDRYPLEVREARDGDPILPGQVLLAPGDHHMELQRSGARYHVTLNQRPPVNRHRPSVDVLFESTAECAGANAIGVILTGMGADGARGLKAMRDRGAGTIAQDEATSVVYGMPAEAFKLGGAVHVEPLDDIARRVLELASMQARALGAAKPNSPQNVSHPNTKSE